MTICNGIIEPESVMIVTDSEGSRGASGTQAVTKIFPLPHLSAALTGAGSHVLMIGAMGAANTMPGGFDQVREGFAAALDQTWAHIRPQVAPIYLAAPGKSIDDQIVGLYGWSTRGSRMVGSVFIKEAPEAGFRREDLADGVMLQPWEPIEGRKLPRTLPEMVATAKLQRAFIKAQGTDLAAGGRLMVAQLTRNAITIAATYDLDGDRWLNR